MTTSSTTSCTYTAKTVIAIGHDVALPCPCCFKFCGVRNDGMACTNTTQCYVRKGACRLTMEEDAVPTVQPSVTRLVMKESAAAMREALYSSFLPVLFLLWLVIAIMLYLWARSAELQVAKREIQRGRRLAPNEISRSVERWAIGIGFVFGVISIVPFIVIVKRGRRRARELIRQSQRKETRISSWLGGSDFQPQFLKWAIRTSSSLSGASTSDESGGTGEGDIHVHIDDGMGNTNVEEIKMAKGGQHHPQLGGGAVSAVVACTVTDDEIIHDANWQKPLGDDESTVHLVRHTMHRVLEPVIRRTRSLIGHGDGMEGPTSPLPSEESHSSPSKHRHFSKSFFFPSVEKSHNTDEDATSPTRLLGSTQQHSHHHHATATMNEVEKHPPSMWTSKRRRSSAEISVVGDLPHDVTQRVTTPDPEADML